MNKNRLLSSLFLSVFIFCCCSLRAAESPSSKNKGYHGNPYSWQSYVNPKAYINWILKTKEYSFENIDRYEKAKAESLATQLKEANLDKKISILEAIKKNAIKNLNKFSEHKIEDIQKSLKQMVDAEKAVEIDGYKSTINNHKSTINNHKSTINNYKSTINNHKSTINSYKDIVKGYITIIKISDENNKVDKKQRDKFEDQLNKMINNDKSPWHNNHRGKILLGAGIAIGAIGKVCVNSLIKIIKNKTST